MADTKISDMSDIVSLAAGDKIPVADASALTTNTYATMTELVTYLQTLGMPMIRTQSGSAYTVGNTTGTEVTSLSFNTLAAGTYFCRWSLLVTVAATTTSPKFGVNISANLTRFAANAYFPSAGVIAATGTWNNAANATTGQVWAYANTVTASTTAPNLGPWIGVTTASASAYHLALVDALVVISGTADIELWCGADETNTVTLNIGSSGHCIRTA